MLAMRKWILLPVLAVSLQCFAQVDFRKETIYFLITTRFFDGDPTNDRPNEWCSYYPGNPNNANFSGPEDVTWRGDFKGLIQKLDYIKDLGFTAIWITPIVQNRGPLDYHGYHAWDFSKVDPRLESTGATFKDFVSAAHAKGIKVVLDIVTNHSGRYGIKTQSELKYNTDTTASWGKKLDGTALTDNPNWQYDGKTANPDDGKYWSRANLAKMPSPYNQNLKAYNWPSTESFVTTSDPNWYHHSGNGFAQGWDDTTNLYQRAIADDCPDLNTGSQTVQDYFFNVYKKYIDDGVDAFRWDTWKHMNKGDIFALYDRFKAYKPDLFVFGEVAQKRHELHPVLEINPHWYTWRGDVGTSAPAGVGVLDFFAESTFHGVFEDGGALSGVTAAARYDNLYSDPSLLVTWIDNHDFGPNNDWNKRFSGSDENLAACMNFMFTWRGIPCVYYGTESRFMAGAYTDLHDGGGTTRSLNETGRAYFGDAIANAPNHKIYKHIRKLNAIRKAVPALQNGTWQWAGNAPYNGVGYTRQSGSSFVCVGLVKDGGGSFSITGIPNGVYRDAVTGRESTVSNGSLQFSVTSGSAGIYVKDGPGMIGESGAGFFEACANGCAAPVSLQISPASDNYQSPVNVGMTASGGTGNKKIYYTLDGSAPSTSSTLYTGSFSVSTETTVRAVAVDDNNKQSEWQAQRYTFVLPPPVVNITPATGNYYSPVSVTMSASGGTAPYIIYYTTNGTDPTTSSPVYTAPFNVSTATNVKAIAKDANNTLSSIEPRSYTFDIPNPTVSASPAGGNFNGGSVNVTLTATSPRPPVTIRYTTDNSTPTVSSSVYSTPIALSGGDPDTLKYYATDAEGRTSSVQTSIYTYYPIPNITVFFKRPSTWSTGIRIHYWNGQPANVVTPTTWPGVLMTKVCGDWYSYTFSGVNSISMVFNDGAGKQTADLSASATSYYDNGWLITAPNISAPIADFSATPGLSGTAPYEVTFNGSLSSGCNGVVGYQWDFGNGQTGSGAQPTTVYTNAGVYNATLTVVDNVAQTSSITKTVTVTQASAGFWVYFKKPSGWGSATKIQYWNRMPGNTSVPAPGVDMTLHCGSWYKYYFSNTSSVFMVISDGTTTNKTADLQANQATTFIGSRKILGAPDNEQQVFANFEMTPAVGRSPLSVTFSSEASIACGTISSYAWDFGNGQTGSGASPTTNYNADGTYNINLSITDNNNVSHNLSKKILVGPVNGTLKVHLRRPSGWGNTPSMYFWSPTPTVSVPAWPGTLMQDEGNGWYVLTVAGASCANVVLNNTSTPQTSDLLNVCGEQWYDNGWLSQVLPSVPLPVKLLAFTGTESTNGIRLDWKVSAETDIKSYWVERSTNGRNFTDLKAVAAHNSTTTDKYTVLDAQLPTTNFIYYRLRVEDKDGKYFYSAVVEINLNGKSFIHISPNPAKERFIISMNNALTQNVSVRLMNATGQLLFNSTIPAGSKQQEVRRLASWVAGMYWVEMKDHTGNVLMRQKIVLE